MRQVRRVLDSCSIPEPSIESQVTLCGVSLHFCRSFSTLQRRHVLLFSVAVQTLAGPVATSDAASHVDPFGPY
jgi:hypothetical protein